MELISFLVRSSKKITKRYFALSIFRINKNYELKTFKLLAMEELQHSFFKVTRKMKFRTVEEARELTSTFENKGTVVI